MNKQTNAGLFVALSQVIYLASAVAYDPWYTGVGFGYAAGAYGGGYAGAQTPFSAGATGMANLVRAQGVYNETTSRAAINNQQAEKQYIENVQRSIAARQSIKRMAHAETAKSAEEARAQLARSEEFLAAHRPPPLSSAQFDSSTGKLNWPTTLRLPDFDAQRKGLDQLFENRAKYGPTADNSAQIEVQTGELKDALRGFITKVPLPEYSEARQFLDNMSSSAR